MASQRTVPVAASPETGERRRWLSHGLSALAVSALGIAVAGSMALTTPANSTPADAPPVTTTPVRVSPTPSEPAEDEGPFTAPEPAVRPPVRVAAVKERAAQRDEELASDAEAITRSARTASSSARDAELSESAKARQTAAEALAKQRLAQAVAARLAATGEREEAETEEAGAEVDPTQIPTGGGAGVSPVPGAVIGASFGQYGLWSRYHTGIDFRAAYGTPIRAVKPGIVRYAGNSGDWAGIHVAIEHAGGLTTMSSHMSSMSVQVGQSVQAGQVIGYVGQTGRAFGAHLHFELYPAGVKYSTLR